MHNQRYIDRPFIIRPLCLWAFFVGVTVVLCFWSFWAAGVWIVLLCCLLLGCQFLKTKDKTLQFFGSSRLFFAAAIALCLIVVLSFGVTTLIHTHQQSYAGKNTLLGVVESYRVGEETYFITLSEAKFDGKNVSGRVIKNISVEY